MSEVESQTLPLQLMSPELTNENLNIAVQNFKSAVKHEISTDPKFVYKGSLDVAKLGNSFGVFKKAEFSVDFNNFAGEHSWLDDEEGLIMTFESQLHLNSGRYFSVEDVKNIAEQFSDSKEMDITVEVETLENGWQRLKIKDGRVGIDIGFGFPDEETARKSTVAEEGLKEPADKLNVWIYPMGDERIMFNVEPYGKSVETSPNKSEVGELVARIPDSLSLVARTMKAVNNVLLNDVERDKIVNWIDTNVKDGFTIHEGMVFNKSNFPVGYIVGGSGNSKVHLAE